MESAGEILHAARVRAESRQREHKPPDYRAANEKFKKQKAALTRAVKTKDRDTVVKTVTKAVREWSEPPFNGAWPDDWSAWQRALDDVLPWNDRVLLEDLG